MNNFDFLVCQLSIGCESKPTPQSTDIACSIVEQYFLAGQQVTSSLVHYANAPQEDAELEAEVEQIAVD